MNRLNSIYKILISSLFLLFIGVVSMSSIALPDKAFSESENRVLKQMPGLSAIRVMEGKFTTDFEKYISDQMVMRDLWIGIKTDFDRLLGKRENGDVYLGRDGQLLQKFSRPSSGDLEERAKAVSEFSQSHPGVKVYLALVPDSIWVLKDKLPPMAPSSDEMECVNVLRKNLQDTVHYIDLYDALSPKREEYIYYKTDHHWTTKGAYYGYQRLGEHMGYVPYEEEYYNKMEITRSFYGSLYSKSGFRHLKSDTIELYTPKGEGKLDIWYYEEKEGSDSFYDMDSLKKKDKYTVFMGGNHPAARIRTGNAPGRKLLLIKDSFANSLIPFLACHYSEIYMVDLRYFDGSIKELVQENNIEEALILYGVNSFFENDTVLSIIES